MPRIAVVTPYYKETDDILVQCHESVLRQTVPCTHILVADGHPKGLFDNIPNTMHMALPQASADYGNTPRGLGGLLAESYGFDAVAYLDADNWYEPEHIQNLLKERDKTLNPLITCKRKFYDFKGDPLSAEEEDENADLHVDTSCWLIFRPAFSLLRTWFMPKPLGPLCDRVFLGKAIHDRFQITMTNHRTVAYRTLYAAHYQAAGAPVPENAKTCDTGGAFHAAISYLHSIDGVIEATNALGFYPRIW
jgi:glycosyltransferase involved in cell wall biosynthesis